MIPGESVPPRRSASAPPSLPFLRRFGAAAGQLPPGGASLWALSTEPGAGEQTPSLVTHQQEPWKPQGDCTLVRVHTPLRLRLLSSVLRLPIADLTRRFVTHCKKGLPAKINQLLLPKGTAKIMRSCVFSTEMPRVTGEWAWASAYQTRGVSAVLCVRPDHRRELLLAFLSRPLPK